MDTSVPLKRCSKCGEEKPETTEYFYKDERRPDGLISWCKVCSRERDRRYAAEHPEKSRERQRRYAAKHPDKVRERDRRYYAEHTEERRERDRRYYAEHAEKGRDYSRLYRAEHPEEKREYKRRYRAEHLEEVRESESRYYTEHAEERRESSRHYRIKHPEEVSEYQRRYRAEHPEESRAYVHKRRALMRGSGGTHTPDDVRLQIKAQTDKRGRLNCWLCGKPIKDAYHVDHWYPLDKDGSNGAENIRIMHAKCNLHKGVKTPQEMGRLL